jgi:signal transduction histidine kinase
MLEQAMTNVFKNAVEAICEARPHGGVVDVEVKTDVMSEMVRVDVTDNGCGIPDENIPELATLYSTKGNKKANSGIELFITARILKLHDGRLEARSKLGEGTTVSILIPAWRGQTELGRTEQIS